MTLAHLHLVLNHFPTVGTVIGLGLFLLSFIRKNDHLKRASLEVFCIIALVTLPAYLSGVAAQPTIENRPDVSRARLEAHQDAAVLAFLFMELTGAVAWLGLWQFRRISRPARWNLSTVLLLSIVTVLLMARTATLGGEIRHPEILVNGAAGATEETVRAGTAWLTAASIAAFARGDSGRTWVWPASEALHFIGLWLLFGVVLLVNLRMLGMMKSASFAAVHRLLPWAILGLGINTITGMLFVTGIPDQYLQSFAFYWKMGLLLLAGVNVLYFTVFDEPWAVGPGDDAPLTVKAMAALSLVTWVGVMYFGRMLPFLGEAF